MNLPESQRLRGLVAAPHTPFHHDGSLNLNIVEKQAAHLRQTSVAAAFIGGTTGESHSLSLAERRALAQRWMEVTRGSSLRVVVHVGSNSLLDAADLAQQARELGAAAIAALAPSYFKPRSTAMLIECCRQITAAAPETPFYFYDIPILTGVNLSMPEFLAEAGTQLPSLAGIKFTNMDLMNYQLCQRANGGAFDILWGFDEALIGGLAAGARGAVGSTYNFAAPIYTRLMAAFTSGDLAAAREEQFRSVQLIQLLAKHGFMGAAKATMKLLGMDVGPARLPHASLDAAQTAQLERELKALGFFEWIR